MIQGYKCKRTDCFYRREIVGSIDSCDYILMNKEGKSRGCDAENCDKYVKRGKNNEKILKKCRKNSYLNFANPTMLPHIYE